DHQSGSAGRHDESACPNTRPRQAAPRSTADPGKSDHPGRDHGPDPYEEADQEQAGDQGGRQQPVHLSSDLSWASSAGLDDARSATSAWASATSVVSNSGVSAASAARAPAARGAWTNARVGPRPETTSTITATSPITARTTRPSPVKTAV